MSKQQQKFSLDLENLDQAETATNNNASCARANPHTSSSTFSLAAGSSNTRFNLSNSKPHFSSCARAKLRFAHPHSGFTLIEVMVVIVILGVLAALIVPNVMGRGEKAKVDTTQIALKGVAGALDQYKLDNGHFPTMQEGGLDALVNQPASAKNWLPGGYVKGGYPKDSWDNDLQYVTPGTEGRSFDLYSFGADGQSGGEGNNADIYYKP